MLFESAAGEVVEKCREIEARRDPVGIEAIEEVEASAPPFGVGQMMLRLTPVAMPYPPKAWED
jgi:hypothetical protein